MSNNIACVCHQAFINAVSNCNVVHYIKLLNVLKDNMLHPIKMHDICSYRRSWYKYCPEPQQDFSNFINMIEDKLGMHSFVPIYTLFIHYAYIYKVYLKVKVTSSNHLKYVHIERIKQIIANRHNIVTIDLVNEINSRLIGGFIIEYSDVTQDFSFKRQIETSAYNIVQSIRIP